MSTLPYPERAAEIRRLFKYLLKKHEKLFDYNARYDIEETVQSYLKELGFGTGRLSKSKLHPNPIALFDIYSMARACNQVNEACNKLWATMELAYATSPKIRYRKYDPIGESFDSAFLLGSLIPTLYYSQLSAILACLSTFGCISLRDAYLAYNVVRTKKGWRILERKKYIKDTFGFDLSVGWHSQLIQLLRGFKEAVSDFPAVNHSDTVKLRELRDITHYEILSDVSAAKVAGIERYFEFLPLVVNTINSSLGTLSRVFGLPAYSGAERFRELHDNLSLLYRSYKKKMPKQSFNKVEF